MRLRTKNLADYAQEKAFNTPEAVAIYLETGEHITFGSIFKEAMALAASLSKLGLNAGDVISFQLPNWARSGGHRYSGSVVGVGGQSGDTDISRSRTGLYSR